MMEQYRRRRLLHHLRLPRSRNMTGEAGQFNTAKMMLKAMALLILETGMSKTWGLMLA
jgi:hypothetical protein